MLAIRVMFVAAVLLLGACAPQPAKRAVATGGIDLPDAALALPDGSPPPPGGEEPDAAAMDSGGSPPDTAVVVVVDALAPDAPRMIPPDASPPRPPVDAAPDAPPPPRPDAAPDLPPPARAALFVSATTTLGAIDVTLRARMQALGLTVTVTTPAAVTAADAAGKAVVIISGTIDSPMLGTKLRDVPVPVLSREPNLMDDMRLSTDASTTSSQTQLSITDTAHPLAGGLEGNVAVYTAAASIVTGTPAPGAIIVATVLGDPAHPAIYAYATGTPMVGGIAAPAKRVGFFINDNQPTIVLTADGQKLFESAVTWMMTP
jgi:hypothetical protein